MIKLCVALLVNLLALCLAIRASAITIAAIGDDCKLDVEELRNQLDSAKEPIDLACDACKVSVDVIQCLIRGNSSEDTIVEVATELCNNLNIPQADSLVCKGIVPEFKVSM